MASRVPSGGAVRNDALFFTAPPDRPLLTCYYKQKNPKVIGLQLPLATPSGRLNPLYRGYRSPPGQVSSLADSVHGRPAALDMPGRRGVALTARALRREAAFWFAVAQIRFDRLDN